MYKVYIKIGRRECLFVSSICLFIQGTYPEYLPTLPEVPTQQHQSLNTTIILLLVVLHYTTLPSYPFVFFFLLGGENRTEQNRNRTQWAAHPLRLLVMRIAG